jgi:hypothetical protein
MVGRSVAAVFGVLGARRLYRLFVRGALTIDTGVGRRLQRLGPVRFEIAAPREVVFDVIAGPYLGRTPLALQSELQVWERGTDMVLAAHFTEVKCGVATTLETVRFVRPERIDFRVVRGPVPHVVESFVLEPNGERTALTWEGELGTDFWAIGSWWGERVARQWERAVRRSLAAITAEAERRATRRSTPARAPNGSHGRRSSRRRSG